MENLKKKYGVDQKFIDMIIEIDILNSEEIADLEYMEDRIQTHLEEIEDEARKALTSISK